MSLIEFNFIMILNMIVLINIGVFMAILYFLN